MRAFVAGASGVIGSRLVAALVREGHEVVGSTRASERVELIERLGGTGVVVDAHDRDAMRAAIMDTKPDVVVDLLTDLGTPGSGRPDAQALARTSRLRRDATPAIAKATTEAGARRLIATSLAWIYRPGREPHTEDDPVVEPDDPGTSETLAAVVTMERAILSADGLEHVLLRCGQLYGVGTGLDDGPTRDPAVHVEAAAWAAALASTAEMVDGIFNVCDDSRIVSNEKARRILGWSPLDRL
jgi:nucleoside-diphosphate-sugar epimerase